MPVAIDPQQLSATAVFPQCLDNQYLDRGLFNRIVNGNGIDYDSEEIRQQRAVMTKAEFHRALLYSREVVINRAYLINNAYIYGHYLPGSPSNSPDFVDLISTGVVVPFLFNGDDVFQDLDRGAVSDEGRKALEHLVRTLDDFRFLRLADSGDQTRSMVQQIEKRFSEKSVALGFIPRQDELFNDMLANVFGGDENQIRPAFRTAFADLLKRLSTYVHMAEMDDRKVTRQEIYQDFLVGDCSCLQVDCQCVALGRFTAKNAEDERLLFGVKSLVDIVYNTGVPDLPTVERFTFTPQGLPNRNALQDFGSIQPAEGAGIVDDLAVRTVEFARRFHADASTAMTLPRLEHLTIGQILEARSWPEWARFMAAQDALLSDPLGNVSRFADFQEAFEAFQGRVSTLVTGQLFDQDRRFMNWVSASFRILGRVVRVGISERLSIELDPLQADAIDVLIDEAVNSNAERLTVGPARLLFEVFDAESRAVDRHRSWSIDWMRAQVSWSRSEVIDFLQAVKHGDDANLLADTGLAASGRG
ncbi:MAG: hypothetical protein AAF531_06405 [Actinomycetota bacterium]